VADGAAMPLDVFPFPLHPVKTNQGDYQQMALVAKRSSWYRYMVGMNSILPQLFSWCRSQECQR